MDIATLGIAKDGIAAQTKPRTRLISLCDNGEWHEVAVKPRNMLVEVKKRGT